MIEVSEPNVEDWTNEELIHQAQAFDKRARSFRDNTSPWKEILYEYSLPRELAFKARKLARIQNNE